MRFTHLLSSSDMVSDEPCEATEVPASELRIECESSGTVSVTNKCRLKLFGIGFWFLNVLSLSTRLIPEFVVLPMRLKKSLILGKLHLVFDCGCDGWWQCEFWLLAVLVFLLVVRCKSNRILRINTGF